MPDTRREVSMLSKGEAAALLSLINAHHGNAQWDDVQLDAFHSELRSDITAAEAREAVRRFYADNSTSGTSGRSGVVVSPAAHDGPFLGRVSTGGVGRA